MLQRTQNNLGSDSETLCTADSRRMSTTALRPVSHSEFWSPSCINWHRGIHTNTRSLLSGRHCQGVESSHSAHGDAQRVADHLGIGSRRIKIDSQAKYTVVARGDAEIYLRLPTRKDYVERIWDHAAGALLVTEAGGKVTDCRGNELDFSCGQGLENNYGIVATNGRDPKEVHIKPASR